MDLTAATNVIGLDDLTYGLDGADNADEIFTARAAHWSAGIAAARAERMIGVLSGAKGAPVTPATIEAARARAAQPGARFLAKALDDYDAAARRRSDALDTLAEIDPGCTASTVAASTVTA